MQIDDIPVCLPMEVEAFTQSLWTWRRVEEPLDTSG